MRALLLTLFACGFLLPAQAQNPNDIIITEVMQNPDAVFDSNGEWFEVLNTTSSAIDLQGWSIYDLGSDSTTIDASVVVEAGDFAVMCRNGVSGTNGGVPCDYEYSGFLLGNSGDEIYIGLPNGTVIDFIEYDGGPSWPDPTGASMILVCNDDDGTTAACDEDPRTWANNDADNWTESLDRESNYTQFVDTDRGSPGAPGSQASVLPVELTRFEALQHAGGVALTWATASEWNNAGFEIQRQAAAGAFETLGFVAGNGTTNEPQTYGYRVEALPPGRHVFRLKQVDFDGAFEYSPEVEVAVELTQRFALSEAYPNPFNPATQFTLAVDRRQTVSVEVFNLLGQRVRTLFAGTLEANAPRTFTFDARDLPSGLYLYRVSGETFAATRQMTLLK